MNISAITARILSGAKRRMRSRASLEEEERLEKLVGPPGVWRQTREFQFNFLRKRGLEPTHSLLDIGCGPLRGGIPLIKYLNAGRYVGIDIRPESVEEAKKQIKIEKLESKGPQVYRSESFGAEELDDRAFDYVWCFQVLYHLEDELADQCIEQISKRIGNDGVCYANINSEMEGGEWQEFPYVRRPLDFYQELGRRHGIVIEDLGPQIDWGYTINVPGRTNKLLELRRGSS